MTCASLAWRPHLDVTELSFGTDLQQYPVLGDMPADLPPRFVYSTLQCDTGSESGRWRKARLGNMYFIPTMLQPFRRPVSKGVYKIRITHWPLAVF